MHETDSMYDRKQSCEAVKVYKFLHYRGNET